MKISYFIYCFAVSILVNYSCKPTPNTVQDSPPQQEQIQIRKSTQALLLTQPRPFSLDDKNKISGDYIVQEAIVVPQDLAPQNKWIMFEGPVLENDLIAYRYYADSRHRFDIYGKRVPDLVMDTVSWDYHDIMDWGSDILKVGNSLGLGSPAIYYNDSLYTLSQCSEKRIEILENGDDRSSIRTTFKDLSIDEHSFDLVQDWSITSGKPWSEIHLKISDGKLPDNMYFATGIVKHLPDIKIEKDDQYLYAMNWGKQTFHDEDMGMALIADNDFVPEKIDNDMSHVIIFKNAKHEVKYRFLAAWKKDLNGVKDDASFQELVINSQ